jgi:transcriptional regulator with XRE-family HTH domain
MTYDKRKIEFSQVLEYLAQALDIPESYFEKAEARYQSVGKWLEREGSIVAEFNPVYLSAGSFLFGTVIKPATDRDA